MPDIIQIPTGTAVMAANNDLITAIIMVIAFFVLMAFVIAILWLIETRGSRLFLYRNGIMTKIKFKDKQVTPERFLKISKDEAIQINTQPINLRNMFGSTNPTWFADARYPITLDLAKPDAAVVYPSPSVVFQGINDVIMKELQTYQVSTTSGETIGKIAIGAILGLVGGFVISGFM
jgi:hypothetical protein